MREIRLSSSSTDLLVEEDETGMGFQLIEAMVGGAQRYLVVFNSEVGVEFESENDLRNWLWSPKEAREPATGVPEIDIGVGFHLLAQRILPVGDSSAGEPGAARGGAAGGDGAGGATSSPPLAPPASLVASTTASGARKFYRFSAFKRDRRVNQISGDFAPGTYATTDNDKGEVPSGFAAVGRYALPNTASAIHVFECTPKAKTVIHVGTVAPAYGQAGGGVEVLFPAGATNMVPTKPTTQPRD